MQHVRISYPILMTITTTVLLGLCAAASAQHRISPYWFDTFTDSMRATGEVLSITGQGLNHALEMPTLVELSVDEYVYDGDEVEVFVDLLTGEGSFRVLAGHYTRQANTLNRLNESMPGVPSDWNTIDSDALDNCQSFPTERQKLDRILDDMRVFERDLSVAKTDFETNIFPMFRLSSPDDPRIHQRLVAAEVDEFLRYVEESVTKMITVGFTDPMGITRTLLVNTWHDVDSAAKPSLTALENAVNRLQTSLNAKTEETTEALSHLEDLQMRVCRFNGTWSGECGFARTTETMGVQLRLWREGDFQRGSLVLDGVSFATEEADGTINLYSVAAGTLEVHEFQLLPSPFAAFGILFNLQGSTGTSKFVGGMTSAMTEISGNVLDSASGAAYMACGLRMASG